MVDRLAVVRLLCLVDDPGRTELRLHLLKPRGWPGSREPAAVLGKLDQPGWAVTDGRGELVAPFQPAGGPSPVEDTVEIVLRRARQRALCQLAELSASNRDHLATLALWRRTEGRLKPVEAEFSGDEVGLRAGQELAVEIHNLCGQQLWPYLLDLDAGGELGWLHPDSGAGEPIPPRRSTLVARLRPTLPAEIPYEAPGERPAEGRETLVLFAATEPMAAALLGGKRRPDTRTALGRILSAVLTDQLPAADDLDDPAWSAFAHPFRLRD